MTGAAGNSEANKDQRQPVTSVGNAWIICNSKSRPGLKYYFNTFTGHAAWNLSLAEIEKAKKYTKGLPIADIEKYPEPIDPPMMDPTMDPSQTTALPVLNEPILNNQYHSQIPNNMIPINLLNHLPGGFNPNVWSTTPNNAAVGPGTQVIYVPYQPAMNYPPAQNVHANLQGNIHNVNNRDNTLNNNWGRHRYWHRDIQQSQNWHANSPDLRQKLTRKRSKSQSYDQRTYDDYGHQDFNAKNNCEGVTAGPSYNNINANIVNMQEETFSKYDLSVLKHLKPSHSKAGDNWFIVVDTEIILYNFPFLNKITDPDQNFYLMVPEHVMAELQLLAANGSDVRTRRIYRFLSAQIDNELAFRGDDMEGIADNETEKTFTTCADLAMQNNNVILLSNDIKLYSFKNKNYNVHVLTMTELRMMLQNKPAKQMARQAKSPTMDIQIIVPNNRERDYGRRGASRRLNSKAPEFEIPSYTVEQKDRYNSIQSNFAPSSSKQTIDNRDNRVWSPNPKSLDSLVKNTVTGRELDVSTEVNTSERMRSEKRVQDSFYCNETKKQEMNMCRTTLTQSTMNENEIKKREIKLCRTTPQTTITEKNTQAKQYRWRKQRVGANKDHPSISSSVTSDQATSMDPVKAKDPVAFEDYLNPEKNIIEIPKSIFSPSRAPSVDRSSLSSHCKRIERPNIVIEETSTSGVISNTNDSESTNSTSLSKDKKVISFSDDTIYVMYQVAGCCMEEVLRTRREEWVLRFVQIMEEVLREKLRDNSPLQSKDYAAPWATDLPELARCIIKKYSDYFNVVDAANRLSFTLHRISDSKGNMRPNIEPGQYMDMYSYGVYLVEALKDVTDNCEDLKAADESLKKLLYDIQNANLESMHHDTIVDDLNESAGPIRTAEIESPFLDSESMKETSEDKLSEKQSDNNRYSLRSRKVQNQSPNQKKSAFFSSLELKKRLNTDNTSFVKKLDFQETPDATPKTFIELKSPSKVPSPKILQTSPNNSLEVPVTPVQQTSRGNDEKDALNGVDSDVNNGDGNENGSSAVQISFVRNFTSIAQFEEKLLNKSFLTDDYDDELDYEDDNYNDSEYPLEYPSEYYGENGGDVVHENADLEDGEIPDSEDGKIANDPAIQDGPNKENLQHSDIENSKKFKWFIAEFMGEMRESFQTVQKLCIEFVEEFKNSQKESSLEMKEKLRAACAAMLSISNALNSILDRESTSQDNIILLLKKANLEDFVPDEDLRLEYTDVINKCREQAFICYKTVTLIMREAGIRKVA